jgi:hypothetical protein
MNEVPLVGGRTTAGVVKVGQTVRRPMGLHSDFVHELLTKLDDLEFPHSPKFLGIDESGREILTFVDGEVPQDLGAFELAQISKGGSILRALHDVTLQMCGNGQVICHGDASPCNYVFQDSVPACLIDFDAAFIGDRRIDFGYGCWLWSNIGTDGQDVAKAAGKLSAYMLGYGEEPIHSLEAMSDAQDWLMAKLLREERQELQPVVDWVASCQKWLNSSQKELKVRLT